MAFLSNCALFHVIFRARFIVSLRPSFLPGPGLGALLSSYLEVALYKSYRQIDRYQLADVRKVLYLLPPVRMCPHLTKPPPPSLRTFFMDGPFCAWAFIVKFFIQKIFPHST